MADIVTSPYALELWTREISIDYLADRLGWTGDECDGIAEDLSDFGPAVRIINAIAAESGWTAEETRGRLASPLSFESGRFARVSRAVTEVVAEYLAESRNSNLAEWHLTSLATLAYLPPSISATLLPAAALTLDSPALAPFFALRVIAADNDRVLFDPRLQHAARTRLRKARNPYGLAVALSAVDRVFSKDLQDIDDVGWRQAILNAVDAVLGHIEAGADQISPRSLESAAKLAFRFSKYRRDQKDYAAARGLTKLGIGLEHRAYGSEDDNVGVSYSNFGDLLKKSGDFTGAREAYLRSIEIAEAHYGAEHAKLGLRLAKLGGILKRLRDVGGARVAYERSVRIGEATLTVAPDISEALHEPETSTILIDVYGDDIDELLNELRAFAELLRTANVEASDAARCESLVYRLPETGYAVSAYQVEEIAELLFAHTIYLKHDKKLDEARRVLERVISIRERLPESGEHRLGRTLAAYAILLRQIGDLAALRAVAQRLQAMRPLIETGIAAKTKPPASTSPPEKGQAELTKPGILATRYEHLGIIARDIGDLEAATSAFGRSIELTEKSSKPGKVLTNRLDLQASALRALGSVDAACAIYTRAIAIAGRTDPNTEAQSNRLDQFAALRKEQGDVDAAITALWKAVAVDDAGGRANTKAGAIHLNNLARTLEMAGDLGQAEAVFERALRAASYDSGDLPLRTVLTNFALMQRRKGDLDNAIWYAKRAVDLDKASGRPSDAGAANRLANAAVILYDRGEYNQSAAAFEEAHSIRLKLFGDEDATSQTLREWVSKVRAMAAAREIAT